MSNLNLQSTMLGKIAAYTEILVKDPKSTIFVSLAETYRKMGMFEDARQIINKGIELHPEFSPAYIVLARVFCQLENHEDSILAFNRALELDSESLAAYVGLARVKILLGDENDARQLLLQARKLSPADPVINKLLLSLPKELVDSESTELSDDETEKNSAPLVSATLAELYLKQGLINEALQVYLQLSAAAPDDLSLRRKVRELQGEAGLEENASAKTDETVLDVVSEEIEATGELNSSEIVQQSSEIGACYVQEEQPVISPEEAVLNTLNCWLAGIEQRRGHV